jgi:predicted TIM-barrel fold metal-dependent hydrolase
MMLALKYKNIYLDTSIVYSGTPREALGAVLAGQIGLGELERDLHTQILFGSNYPRTDIRRSVRGIGSLELSASLRHHITDGNARRLLGM